MSAKTYQGAGTDGCQALRPKAIIDGWGINLSTPEEAIANIISAASRSEGFACMTLNLDHLVKIRTSPEFRKAYHSARFITADGAPVAKIARRQSPDIVRTTGADLLLPLCLEAAAQELPIYLFGTSDEVLEKTARFLKKQTKGRLVIAGMMSPPQGFDVAGHAADKAIESINASKARLCFVLLGAPKQEIFAARAVGSGSQCGFICVGAAADFIAGHQIRAPRFFQGNGLEWLWRLSHNPRRLGLRYFQCALVLIRLQALELWRSRH